MNRIKLINKLKLRKYRDEMGLFIVEGDKLIEEIPKNLIEFVLNVDDIGEREFKKLSELTTPQSVIAVCHKPNIGSRVKGQGSSSDNLNGYSLNTKLTIALDRIQDPNNVGAILRTTAAAGLKNVIILEGTADPFSPKSIRASMGAIFHLNLITMTEEELINADFKLIAAHIEGINYREFELPKKSVLILGNEGQGVSKKLLEVSTKVNIPIQNVESLNVNAAAAILIFHFAA